MGAPVILEIEKIYYPVLAVIGVPVNLMTVVVLFRGDCGLSKCISRYLLGMAVADLLVLIFGVVLYEIKDAHFTFSFLNYTPICSLNIALLFMSIDWSVWLTVAFTFDRFVAICHQTYSKKYCTEKTAALVITVVCSLSLIENAPINFIFEPREIINNAPWSCYVKPSFCTLTIWIAFLWLEIILTPFVPFLLILLFNAQTIRHIVQANRVRRGLRGKNNSEEHNDPELENRRKSIVLLLIISASFMILWAVMFVFFIFVNFTDAQISETSYDAPFTIVEQTGYMLRYLSSCTNTFIYAVSQKLCKREVIRTTQATQPSFCIPTVVLTTCGLELVAPPAKLFQYSYNTVLGTALQEICEDLRADAEEI
ncbi:probable G-protein coupled receptor 139 [Heptranchias perlo]|uniref:probable G-protein coupled receptor 139 n=1 Tax=Heptranchias perlo TaxID=212740 RepID=UPI00355A2C23